jgi:16S rRNA (adenine1518-N6/adenine1519-N6)-dimethyltransferase
MTRSPGSRPSRKAPSASRSPGSRLLTRRRLTELAQRHQIRPRKSLGQHFLADPNLARLIVREAGVGPRSRVLEIGAGLGSLTIALQETGANVLAIETDRALIPALRDVVEGLKGVRIVHADAMRADWRRLLGGRRWTMASNLPYNVAVPVVMDLLVAAPKVDPLVVMVQREVGERLVARPGEEAFGAVSLRVAYRASAKLLRRVPPSVFWPEPKVESVLVRLERQPPPVAVSEERLFRLVEEGFGQRRKTMANALVRLGLGRAAALEALAGAGLGAQVRAEELGLEEFARLSEAVKNSLG